MPRWGGTGRALGVRAVGMFDFLKIIVSDRKKPVARKPRKLKTPNNVVSFDGKSFPILSVTSKGFMAGNFDGSLIKGQAARITVKLDDSFAKLDFQCSINVVEAQTGGRLVGEWNLITPELENTLRKYTQMKKASK